MTAVSRVAIAGGGVAGIAAAILLAEGGVHVDVFEQKPDPGALGSGITLQGNALRVFGRLGIWPAVKDASYSFDVLGIRAPGPEAPVLAQIPDQRTGGEDYPATAGMYRPDLARILTERAREVGANIHLGSTVVSFDQDADGVDVTSSGGRTDRYDILIGADGLHSGIRSMLGIDTRPQRTGMGIWRAFVPRPESVTHTDLYYGGPAFIAGYCPTGEDTMYAYLVEEAQDHGDLDETERIELMRALSHGYGGPWEEIRAS
ncbi:MAG TPA: FAD-dependent monooxygenase, partial [Microterricola sp.]